MPVFSRTKLQNQLLKLFPLLHVEIHYIKEEKVNYVAKQSIKKKLVKKDKSALHPKSFSSPFLAACCH